MNSSSKQFFNNKTSSPPRNISERWLGDEKLVFSNKCKFDVQYLGSTEISKPNDLDTCCSVLKDLIGKKKLVKGILKVTTFSVVLSEKSTLDVKVDQTLKDIVFCSSHPLIPYAFFYTTRDPVLNTFQLWGFISMKEVSDRIITAILFALQFYSEKQAEYTNYLPNYQKSQLIEQDKAFKQISLRERFQDPQSSIVISSLKIPISKTFTDIKSIPRPKPCKKNSCDLFPNLNQNNLFKNTQYEATESVNSKNEYSSKEDLVNVFMPKFEETLSYQNNCLNKSMPETLLFNISPNSENDASQTSKYDIFKSTNTPLASTGWSEEIAGIDKSKPQPTKNKGSLEFDQFISVFIENSDLKKKLN